MFEHHVLVLHESKEHGFFNNVPFFKPLKYAQLLKMRYRSYETVFHALFVCGHYFAHYGFIQVCIFYQFFWKTIFVRF